MNKPFILAIDPGVTTGMCLIQREPLEVLWSKEIPEQYDAEDLVHDVLTEHFVLNDIDVVIERFVINAQTAKKSPQPASMEIIGTVKYLTQYYTDVLPFLYAPSEVKNFSTNVKLRALGMWHVGGEGHANDSLRHALFHMVKTGFSDRRMLKD